MFHITENKNLDIEGIKREHNFPTVGGVVTFEGRVRNHNDGRDVHSLEYEVYEELAKIEGERIIKEAMEKFEITHAYGVHWAGQLEIGELAVWIMAQASHRGEAFRACQYIIDEVKGRVPVWKKELYADGEAKWVRCDHCHQHFSHNA